MAGPSDPAPPLAVAAGSRFAGLDGLRGVAALLVAIMHGEMLLGMMHVGRAYLMVDLFFLMSGFVLSAGYGHRLQGGGLGGWFAKTRFLRLYPLAMLGLLMGLAVAMAVPLNGIRAADGSIWRYFALATLLLPWLGGGLVVPLNGPLWSLQLEFWINVLYGALARWLTNARLAMIVCAAAAVLALIARTNGTIDGGFAHNPGQEAGSLAYLAGCARIGFSFPLGILLHRLWLSLPAWRRPGPLAPLILPGVLVAISLIPYAPWPAVDLVAVYLVFPALVLLAAGGGGGSRLNRASNLLGRLSYGLYVIHGPLVSLGLFLLPEHASAVQRAAMFSAVLTASIAGAWAAERWIDAPVRHWASRRGAAANGARPERQAA